MPFALQSAVCLLTLSERMTAFSHQPILLSKCVVSNRTPVFLSENIVCLNPTFQELSNTKKKLVKRMVAETIIIGNNIFGQ